MTTTINHQTTRRRLLLELWLVVLLPFWWWRLVFGMLWGERGKHDINIICISSQGRWQKNLGGKGAIKKPRPKNSTNKPSSTLKHIRGIMYENPGERGLPVLLCRRPCSKWSKRKQNKLKFKLAYLLKPARAFVISSCSISYFWRFWLKMPFVLISILIFLFISFAPLQVFLSYL